MQNKQDKGLSGKVWVNRQVKMARSAFKNHKMAVIGPGHWRLKRPEDGCFWCDIVVMGGCGLAVWGDIDGCFFAYYSGAKRPEELVHWMGQADIWYYGHQKACIGMGGKDIVDEHVDEVAIYDLRQKLKCAKEEFGDEWDGSISDIRRHGTAWGDTTIKDKYTKSIEDAIRSIQYGNHLVLVKNELFECLQVIEPDAWEWMENIGKVPSVRLIYALTAVRRLSQILARKDRRNGQQGGKTGD